MVINGGSRSGTAAYTSYLGAHLQRTDTNERVHVREMHGMAAVDVTDALREMSAVGEGSRSRLPLYHANIDWRHDERMTDAQKARAIERLGEELGLANQPRVVVEHVKEGREHLHVVWCRIDGETMCAIPDSHNYRRHEIVARELEREFEHARVQGAHIGRDDVDRPGRCPTLGETRQAERSGMTAEEAKAQLRELWQSADSGQAFAAALDNAGWMLAQGDKRGFVALDPTGEVRAVNKAVTGLTAAQVRERLGDLDPGNLPTVDQAREQLRAPQVEPEPAPTPEIDREAEELARLEAMAAEYASRDYGDETPGYDPERDEGDLSRERDDYYEAQARAEDAALDAEVAAMRREWVEYQAAHQAQRDELDAIGEAVREQFSEQCAALDAAETQVGDRLKSPEEMRREWADLMRGGRTADQMAAENAPDASFRDRTPDAPFTDPVADRASWAERLRGFASEPVPEARRAVDPVRERERTLKPDAPAQAPEKERMGLLQKLRDLVRGWFEATPRPAPPHDRAADREHDAAGDRQAEPGKSPPAQQPARKAATPEAQPDRTRQPEPEKAQEKARPVERLVKRDFADDLLAEARARLANQTPEQRAEREQSRAEQSRGRGDGSRERTRHHHVSLWELGHPFHDPRTRIHITRPNP